MGISTATWGWPQWVALILMSIAFMIQAANHGKPRLDNEKEPEKYNGFSATFRFAMWVFILSAGGFFS